MHHFRNHAIFNKGSSFWGNHIWYSIYLLSNSLLLLLWPFPPLSTRSSPQASLMAAIPPGDSTGVEEAGFLVSDAYNVSIFYC